MCHVHNNDDIESIIKDREQIKSDSLKLNQGVSVYSIDCGGVVGVQSMDNPVTKYKQEARVTPPVSAVGNECKVVKLEDYIVLDEELKTTKEYLEQIKALLGVL